MPRFRRRHFRHAAAYHMPRLMPLRLPRRRHATITMLRHFTPAMFRRRALRDATYV